MNKKIKVFFLVLAASMQFAVLGLLALPGFAQAQSQPTARCSKFIGMFTIRSETLTDSAKTDPSITQSIPDVVPKYCTAMDLFTAVLNILFMFSGGAAVLFIVIGGFQYMTSSGNDELAESAKKTLTNALIGLVVIILAATIVRLVVNTLSNTPSQVPPGTQSQTSGASNTGVSGSGGNTGAGGNTGVNYGAMSGGGASGLNELLSSGKAVSLEPAVVTPSTAQISFALVIPANMKEAFDTGVCNSQTKTFTINFSSGAIKTSQITGGPSGYFSSVQFPAGVVRSNETAKVYICGNEYPAVSVPYAGDLTPVTGGNTDQAMQDAYFACMNEKGDPNECCTGREVLSVCGGGSSSSVLPTYSASQVSSAAGSSSFSVVQNPDSFVINISTASTYVDIMCGNYPASQRAIHWIINGADNPEYALTVRQVEVPLNGRAMPTVAVSICGSTLIKK